VAEKLQLSENTVRNQLAMAMQQVQEYIQKKLGMAIPVSLLLIICDH
jgi:DNA-directed RNA polymerase specialized sigma24 family protein